MRRYLLLIVCNFILFFIAGKLILPEEPAVTDLKYRFTFVSSQEWPQMGKGIRSADAELGTDTRCLASKSSTVEKQTALVHKAIYANVDGIITTGSDYSEGLAEAVSEAEKKGIPVFLVEADLEDSSRTCYIGPDHFASGVQAGRDMVDACAGEAKVAVIVSSREDGNEMRRLEGFRSITEQFPEMEIVYLLENAGDRLQTKTLLLRMLEENPRINAIYCVEPTASAVVGEVLQSEGFGPADFVIVGYGMSEDIYRYLSDGIYVSSIVPASFREGYEAVKQLKAWLDGTPDWQEQVFIPAQSADADFDYISWKNQGEGIEADWDLS